MHPPLLLLRTIGSGLALLCGALLLCCQTQEPPAPDTILKLKLDDSLSRYDSITVVLLSMDDTTQVLEKVWTGRLPVPDYKLTAARDVPFVVKIQGWQGGGQLALETLIYYENGKKTVVYVEVPPLVPRNWLAKLKPTVGTLEPALQKDTLTYRVVAPFEATTVAFEIQAAFPSAVVIAEGDTVKAGATSKSYPVAATPDTLIISVTELGMAREYRVIVSAEPPPKLALASLVLSAGKLEPGFDQDVRNYHVELPADVSEVSLTLTPISSHNVVMSILARVAFPGVPFSITLEPGDNVGATIVLTRGSETEEYVVILSRPAAKP